jgi:hypothetical protein
MLDVLRSLFFESIVLLVCVEMVAVAVVLARYRSWPTPGRRLTIWIALIGCILLIVLQQVVKTDRERIQAAVRAMATAIDDGDVPALGDQIDGDFRDRNTDRQAWLQEVRQWLQRWQVDEAKVGGFNIEVNDTQAVASFWAVCNGRSGNQSDQVYSSWKLAFVRRDSGWKLLRVIGGKVNMMDYGDFR